MKISHCLLRVKRSLLEAGVSGGLLVGVSGGPDSVALLYMLREIGGHELFAAHLNHGIRGGAADRDALFVRELCGKLDVPYYEGKADVPEMSRLYGMSMEEAARNARYEFLQRIKKRCGAKFIVTAHHLDDQAETVLMHMLRGSGLAGLCGMRVKSGDILRPMLGLSRADIMRYVEENGISYCLDETNLETRYERNRVRIKLIPELKKYNPNIVNSLASMAELVALDEDYFEGLALRALEKACAGVNTYLRGELASLEYPIKSRVAKKMLQNAGKPYDRAVIERLMWLFDAKTGASCSLAGGAVARASYDALIIEAKAVPPEWFESLLNIPGETITPNGIFTAAWAERLNKGEGSYVAYMDAGKLPDDIIIRPRQDGDRFHPLGAKGSKKLKDYLIDKKIPREKRYVPLIACGNEILFFPGGTIAEGLRVTDDTKRVLRVEYINN